ncbi:MAG: primosomal protein N' [Verrucomicrobiota bacterium]|nr:primosomal protein N' [Verrucomicrobiota bacterium]
MIARVALDLSVRKEFDYLVPAELEAEVEVGTRVRVPFGSRELLGTVIEIVTVSPHTNLRSIVKVAGSKSPLTPAILKLAQWISSYYCCPLEMVIKTALPDSVRKEKAGWRERLMIRLNPVAEKLNDLKLTSRQKQLVEALESFGGQAPLQQFLEKTRSSPATVRKLEDISVVAIGAEISERDPYANETILPTLALKLNSEQQVALSEIRQAMDAGPKAPTPRTFLLHGVTGSGKTEVYLQAIAHALNQNKGSIVLVPEISLTPQTVERFKARFSSGPKATLVAVLHSHLSAGERHDEWQKIRQGRARIVIGARSAVFAPVLSLGLIIVDEEHEHSYKQEESPRYHARDVAVMRGAFEKAVTILGSATPSMESYFNASSGKYRLLSMPTRADDKKLPIVRVIDMAMESRREKSTPIFSLPLREAILQRLERKEQTILFLNRRGYASSLQCPRCGHVAGCPNCSIALTYHRKAQKLSCHICGHHQPAPTICPEPKCRNPAIRYAGIGTERVEESLSKLFPQAKLARMDSDTLKRKEDYRRILGDFRTGKIDILVGTQMIAKGLHFPNVTLVGIVYADLSLHIPDFRAGERTFQLLTQVAGRAGRGDVEGEVFVQSLTAYHPAIQYARRHDYVGFYEQEIEFREQLQYPPASRAAMITLRGQSEEKVQFSAQHVRQQLKKLLPEFPGLVIAGPAPSPLLKAETFYRYQIMLRTRSMSRLSVRLAELFSSPELVEDVRMIIDIDPVSLV